MSLIGMSPRFLLRCRNPLSIAAKAVAPVSAVPSKRCFSVASCCSKQGPGCCCGRASHYVSKSCAVSMSSGSPSAICVRSFSSGKAHSALDKKSDPVAALIRQLDQEMKFEADEHEYQQEIMSPAQSLPDELAQLLHETGFQLINKPGESVVFLQKELGNEVIRVEFDVEQVYSNSPYSEEQEFESEDAQEDSQAVSYQLTVTMERKDTKEALKADVWLHDDYCELHGLRFVSANALKELESQQPGSKRLYSGPSVEDLDEALQEAATNYVVSRGINDTLYEFLVNYANFKESAEYYQWCQNVKNFLSPSKH